MVTDNPIWFREQQASRTRLSRHPWQERLRSFNLLAVWLVVTGVIFSVVELSNGHNHTLSERDVREGYLVSAVCACYVQLAYVMFRALVAGATAFARERELQTMDTLLASPLPLSTLLRGKWKVAAWPLLCEVTWVLPLALFLSSHTESYGPYLTPERMLGFYALNLASILCFSAIGLMVSSRAHNTGKASLHAVMIGLVAALGTYMVDVVINMFLNTHEMWPVLEWVNPFTALWSLVGAEPQTSSAINATFWAGTAILYTVATPLFVGLALQRLKKGA
jgi:ABC-type transport system involved in multi-copper enzyme maturation permease subunit